MAHAIARVPTVNGGKYMQQLCKHWSHELKVELDETRGQVWFEDSMAIMTPQADVLEVKVAASQLEIVVRMTRVVAAHLDRFAFREAPLAFDWTVTA